jgi:hypothetical protein
MTPRYPQLLLVALCLTWCFSYAPVSRADKPPIPPDEADVTFRVTILQVVTITDGDFNPKDILIKNGLKIKFEDKSSDDVKVKFAGCRQFFSELSDGQPVDVLGDGLELTVDQDVPNKICKFTVLFYPPSDRPPRDGTVRGGG